MAKAKLQYTCVHCSAVHNKWSGQCGDCGEWNCLEESVIQPSIAKKPSRFSTYAGDTGGKKIQKLGHVKFQENIRTSTKIRELDRVLGGGLVTGSVVLIGGDPGIGKSTLMLQVTATMPEDIKTLYVTGEESLSQISMRAKRLELNADDLECMAETSCEQIIASALVHKPNLMVIDSIQTLYTENLTSIPGSISQVKECAAQLVRFAKQNNTSIIFVGHVTKEGGIAGPRVLEHMVDTVLYFESDGNSRYRILRALKNRFGAVNEIGVFAMTEKGVQEVENPSAIFLSEHETEKAGSVVMVTREGTRPLLIEIQALADQSPLGNPRRLTLGLDHNRLAMLLAVLHRICHIPIHDHDIFLNVVGGMKIAEPAADLAIIMAVVSSFRNRYLPKGTIVFGEVGLTGEIRPVFNGEDRLKEAVNHGFKHAIVPKGNIGAWTKGLKIKVTGVDSINQILDYI